jgi:thiol-disulfide isomerase/thioredoxin
LRSGANWFLKLILLLLAGVLGLSTVGQAASPPINDDFADAIRLTGTNVQTTGPNVAGTKEAGEPNHAGNPGGSSVWWSWTADQPGYVTVSTDESWSSGPDSWWLDTLLGVYVGSRVSRLTLIADNDDNPDFNGFADMFGILDTRSKVSFAVMAGRTYYLAVDGYSEPGAPADQGTIQLSLAFSTEPPPGPPGLGPAPGWVLPDTNGDLINWTNFAGNVVVVNFWATWCGDCLQELPDLVALQRKFNPDGLTVLGISVDEATDQIPPTDLVKSFAIEQSLNYPIVMSRPSRVVEDAFGGIHGIPATFIIDRQNNIVRRLAGAQKETTLELYVKPLIYANLAVHASLSNGRFRLRWPLTQAEFGLESTDDLLAGGWTALSAPVQSDASGHLVELPINSSSKYFRLRSQ